MKKHYGFSVLQIMVIMGIFGIASMAGITMLLNQMKAAKGDEERAKVADFTTILRMATSDADLCRATLNTPTHLADAPVLPAVTNLHTIQPGFVFDQSWEVLESNLFPAPGANAAAVHTNYRVKLRKINASSSFGGIERIVDIPLLVSTNVANEITSCTGPSGGAGGPGGLSAQEMCTAYGPEWTWDAGTSQCYLTSQLICTKLSGMYPPFTYTWNAGSSRCEYNGQKICAQMGSYSWGATTSCRPIAQDMCTALGAGWSWSGPPTMGVCRLAASTICTNLGSAWNWQTSPSPARCVPTGNALCSRLGGTWGGSPPRCTFPTGGGGGPATTCTYNGSSYPTGSVITPSGCFGCATTGGCNRPGCGVVPNGSWYRFRQVCVGAGGAHWTLSCSVTPSCS